MAEQIAASVGMVLAWACGMAFAGLVDYGHKPWKSWAVLAFVMVVIATVNIAVGL